jgi:hypothetical protein
MAGLLSEGGFVVEALPALCEAMESILAGLNVFVATTEADSAAAPTETFIESRLIEPGYLPDWAKQPITRLRTLAGDGLAVTIEEAQFLHEKTREIHRYALSTVGLPAS